MIKQAHSASVEISLEISRFTERNSQKRQKEKATAENEEGLKEDETIDEQEGQQRSMLLSLGTARSTKEFPSPPEEH